MGIQVEFNPDLALRSISEFKKGSRKIEECIPDDLQSDKVYAFLKSGQRNYWLEGEVPLLETEGNNKISSPKASVIILEVTHFQQGQELFTKGQYKVVEVFNDDSIHFDGFSKIK